MWLLSALLLSTDFGHRAASFLEDFTSDSVSCSLVLFLSLFLAMSLSAYIIPQLPWMFVTLKSLPVISPSPSATTSHSHG